MNTMQPLTSADLGAALKPSAIISTSWNGTPLMYNNDTDQWSRADDTTLGSQHYATADDIPAAIAAAERDKVLLKTDPELCIIEDAE